MKPAAHVDEPKIDEGVRAISRQDLPGRKSTECDRPHELITTVAVEQDAEKEALEQPSTNRTGVAEGELQNSTETGDAEEIEYPSTAKLALLTIGLCLVIFVVRAILYPLATQLFIMFRFR